MYANFRWIRDNISPCVTDQSNQTNHHRGIVIHTGVDCNMSRIFANACMVCNSCFFVWLVDICTRIRAGEVVNSVHGSRLFSKLGCSFTHSKLDCLQKVGGGVVVDRVIIIPTLTLWNDRKSQTYSQYTFRQEMSCKLTGFVFITNHDRDDGTTRITWT